MLDCNISTREDDIKIKYGLFDLGPEREMARTSMKYILTDITDIKRSYFKLGFHLHEFKSCKYYEDFGYTTFEEFCENNFDLDKGAISRCINVFLMTTARNDVKIIGNVETRGAASCMSEKFQGYSYSQLCEMLPLDDKQRSQIKPEMTIKEIREMKNKILDISKEDILKFFEYFKKHHVERFTREEILNVFKKFGSRYSTRAGDNIRYDFWPGKVRIFCSEYYSFARIIKYYEECGGTFDLEEKCEEIVEEKPSEKVATSQLKNNLLCANDLVSKRGIIKQQHIKKCDSIGKMDITIYDSEGRLINAYIDCDILLSGELRSDYKKFVIRTKNKSDKFLEE